jgi:serine/threonine protein kinase/formylglycine-generating enzyme required for sulfatase activity
MIGPYRVLARLGAGGMGEVYRAERREPVRQTVAIKVVKRGLASKEVLARFALERRALAAMNHPCIARVLDAGETAGGEPYFVMELVEGLPLDEFCDQHNQSIEQRLRLFQKICHGVQHAHQKGIVHRDLKPGNVLVVRDGDEPTPKILDFGLAKATNRELIQETLFSLPDAVMGTPEYMSPEQAGGGGELIDARTDIYSLGVMLYELLTGELPFPTQTLKSAGPLQALRMIREQDPPRPSNRLTTAGGDGAGVAARRRTTRAALSRALRGDLDWIVMRAMEKEPERRYASAADLAMEVERFLNLEPVLAGPPSAGYRLRKLLRRYRVQAIAAAAVLLTIIAGALVAVRYAIRAAESAELAEANAGTARANAEMARAKEAEARANAEAASESERLANQRAAEIASQNETIRASAEELRRRTEEFDMLAKVVQLEQARAREEELYPAWPEQIAAMRRWLDQDVARLREALPGVRATVEALAARALPVADGEAAGQLRFPAEADAFLHETLHGLTEAIVGWLGDPGSPPAASGSPAEPADEDVRRRLAWAERIEELSIARHQDRWDAARAAIAASPRYAGRSIDLRPQMGLVPIGPNPETGLWEFYHLRSAWDPRAGVEAGERIEIPTHGADGRIAVGADTGIVFVLLPGGTVRIGASSAADEPHRDPRAERDEAPVEVALAPFFVARHELTQGQWQRLANGALPRTPSRYGPGFGAGIRNIDAPVTAAHPVEQVDWESGATLLARHGLALPTEAQWEYACRGGTGSPWIFGAEVADLRGRVNILDLRVGQGGPWPGTPVGWDDGFLIHAPVDALAPNAFGLFHVHGNVREWCRDAYAGEPLPPRNGDGLRGDPSSATTRRAVRGGGFRSEAHFVRAARREPVPPTALDLDLGLRPIRPLR